MNTVVIQKTKNYELFKGILGNRQLSDKHIAELTSSIMQKNLLPYVPIVVNEQMEIIDGQHRFTVAKNNNLDVYYVIVEGAKLEDIQMLNAMNKRWEASDYLESYIALNRIKYIEFNDFIRAHNLSIRQGLEWVIGHEGGHAYTKAFKYGLLDFTDDDIKNAEIKAGLRQDLIPFFIDTGYNRAAFFRAVNHIVERGLAREVVNKIRVAHTPLRAQVSVRDYMRLFEDILNWRRQKELISLVA